MAKIVLGKEMWSMENTTLQVATGWTHTWDKDRNHLLHLLQPLAPAREDSGLRLWRFHYYLGFWAQKTLLSPLWSVFFPSLAAKAVTSGAWNTPCHWTSASYRKCLLLPGNRTQNLGPLKTQNNFSILQPSEVQVQQQRWDYECPTSPLEGMETQPSMLSLWTHRT